MQNTAFNRIARTSRRQNWVLFGALPIVVLLAGALIWGMLRIIEQGKNRLTLDFMTLTGYAQEQENFLQQLHGQNSELQALPPLRAMIVQDIQEQEDWPIRMFEGRETEVGMPFTLACEDASDCPGTPGALLSLGSHLAESYATFWASSYFPASAVFFVNRGDDVSIGVPTVKADSRHAIIDQAIFVATAQAVRTRIMQRPRAPMPGAATDAKKHDAVVWFRAETLPGKLIGMVPAGFPQDIWKEADLRPSGVYAATLLDPDRISVLERVHDPAEQLAFWLVHSTYGQVMGKGVPPIVEGPGLHYTLKGLTLVLEAGNGTWTGTYHVSYADLVMNNIWLPASAGILLVLCMLGSWGYSRWYDRRVLSPALSAQQKILESEAFSRTLIETAPLALCILARPGGEMVLANALAIDWLGARPGSRLPDTCTNRALLAHVLPAGKAGIIDRLECEEARSLYVAYAPTRYMQRDVLLCIFVDVSARMETERNLLRARQAADEASAAKSSFLATMSHEIRTPLYSVLGTLELLSLTDLDGLQRQYVSRMEDSSQVLQQLISDILDISKIEAGQLSLDSTVFSPADLVQNCTGAYAALAQQKGLLLFSCVDVDVPPFVEGDAVRVQQILSNLLGNAIKFTEAGHVIVRLRCQVVGPDVVRLLLEVADSGIGISLSQQHKLFTPFCFIEPVRPIACGAGLGLSICARLAHLMSGEMHVSSEKGIGSCFAFEAEFKRSGADAPPSPMLGNQTIWVRAPHKALADNLCNWLNRWGACASVAPQDLPLPVAHDVLWLDVLMPDAKVPNGWAGRYLCAMPGKDASARAEIDAHNIFSIGWGIDRMISGVALAPPIEKRVPHLVLRVLVAEDNPSCQATLRAQLERLGCEVVLADDGQDALAQWDAGPHDVILTDVNMPYLNGYELARQLRAEGVSCPIVGVTANAMLDEETRCMDAGMDAWLVKPIRLDVLAQVLLRLVPGDVLDTQDARGGGTIRRVARGEGPEKEISVLQTHPELFIRTMDDDLEQWRHARQTGHAGLAAQVLHRMRSALVLAAKRDLFEQAEILEHQLRCQGFNSDTQQDADAFERDVDAFMVTIKASGRPCAG